MKIQKISVDGGFTCPNRDGKCGMGGCTFCNNQAFTPSYCRNSKSITTQIEEGKRFFAHKNKGETQYLVYFQSFSGTYAPVERLRAIYTEALTVENVVGLVIGTRPDCIDAEKLDLLQELQQRHTIQVEFGIESCYDRTLQLVNRGHTFACAEQAIRDTAARGIDVGVHLILGLPGETEEEMLHEAELLSQLPIKSLKLHQLQIMQGTRIAEEWREHPEHFDLFTPERYASLVARFAQQLRSDIQIERVAASAPGDIVLAPRWGLKPQEVEEMVKRNRANTGLLRFMR